MVWSPVSVNFGALFGLAGVDIIVMFVAVAIERRREEKSLASEVERKEKGVRTAS